MYLQVSEKVVYGLSYVGYVFSFRYSFQVILGFSNKLNDTASPSIIGNIKSLSHLIESKEPHIKN